MTEDKGMRKGPATSMDEEVGRGSISGFIEEPVRPRLVLTADLEDTSLALAAATDREPAAVDWAEGLVDAEAG